MSSNKAYCLVQATLELLKLHNHLHVFVQVRRFKTQEGSSISAIYKKDCSAIPMDENGIYRKIKKYGSQVGLMPKEIGAHSLRAGCATYLLEKKVSPVAVLKQMRHKSFDTTQHYNRGGNARTFSGAY